MMRFTGLCAGVADRMKTLQCHLLGQLKESVIALPGEVVVAAKRWRHVGDAAAPVQGGHPGVDQPAGQPAWRKRPCRQEDKLELFRVGYDPPAWHQSDLGQSNVVIVEITLMNDCQRAACHYVHQWQTPRQT